MLWALAAYLGHVVEQLMITSVIREMNPVIYIALFYLFSTLFIFLYHLLSKKHEEIFDWKKASKHKLLVFGFAGGAAMGNALWFTSVYLIGIGVTSFLLIFVRVIVTVYAYIYMKDRFPLDKAVAFATGIAMLLVFSVSGGASNIIGVIAALLSCFGFAMEGITRKKLVEYEVRAENMMLFRNICLLFLSWIALTVVLLMGVVEFNSIFEMSGQSFFLIIVAAFLGGLIVNIFVFHAMRTVKLSQYQALETTKPVFVALCGVMLLGESMNFVQAVSGGIIVLSALYFLKPTSVWSIKIPTKTNIP